MPLMRAAGQGEHAAAAHRLAERAEVERAAVDGEIAAGEAPVLPL